MHESMPELSGLFIFIFLMAGTQGIIMSLVLWRHKSNPVQNRILGWLVCMFSLIFFFFIITNLREYFFHPLYPGVTAGWIFGTAAATLLLMYLRACFGLPPLPRRGWLLWIPPAFFTLLTAGYYATGQQIIKNDMVLGWGAITYIAGITAWGYYRFRVYAAATAAGANSGKTKRYLRLILLFFACYSVVQLLGFVLFPHIPFKYILSISIFIKLLTAAGIYAIAYLNVQHAQQAAPMMMAYPEPGPVEKYKFSSLDDATAESIRLELIKLMETEKLFLQRDLRLKDVADRLNTSVHHVSQVLNERMDLSFSDFVNKHRVEEAMKMLATGDDSKMESLALDAGFNNKVSFNKAFKKFTGLTPSQYKMQVPEGQ